MKKRRESWWARLIVVTILRPLLGALIRRDWRGMANVPRSGGVIIAVNHLSMADPMALSHYMYIAGRWPTFLAKEGVFRIPVLGRLVRAVGQIPVYRGRTDAALALRDAEHALNEQDCAIIVYPEGTCTRDPNLWPMMAKTGAARLALTTKAPVVPMAHWGAQHMLPYGTARFRPFKKIAIIAGPPVDLSKYEGEPLSPATLRDATADVMRAITDLQGELREEEPPAQIYDPSKARKEKLERTAEADTSDDDASRG